MTAEKLQRELQKAREELSVAAAALAPKHKGGEWERFQDAQERCLTLERDVARALGDECAVEVEWELPWDTGAPLPHVLSSGLRTYLIYLVRKPDPNWDGSYATAVVPAALIKRTIAVVEFERCILYKFGAPNDEVLAGHPLHGKGLVAYGAHTVERSRWISEQERLNGVHPQHDPESWKRFRHYLLAFHDETFECIATAHSVKETDSTLAEVLDLCARKLLS
jgi:hypothetical protein